MDIKQMLSLNERGAIEQWARERSQSQYVGYTYTKRHTKFSAAVCRVLGKYLMHVNTQDVSLAPHLMLNGIWEPWITMAIAKHINPGMRCLDVGAHVGYYTILMADLVGPGGHVDAVEPQGWACDCLKRSLSMNGFVNRTHLVQGAAWSKDKEFHSMWCHPSLTGDAMLSKFLTGEDEDESVPEDFVKGPQVITWTVDTIMSQVDLAPYSFIKIDAEGAEREVLTGMAGLLGGSGPLVICVEVKGTGNWLIPLLEPGGLLHGFWVRRVLFDGQLGKATLPLAADADWDMLWLERK